MVLITMKESVLHLEFAPAKGHTLHGGQVAVAALCKKLGLWSLLRAKPGLDTRKDRTRRLIRHLLCVPAKLARHACGLTLRLFCPVDWLDWWRRWQAPRVPA